MYVIYTYYLYIYIYIIYVYDIYYIHMIYIYIYIYTYIYIPGMVCKYTPSWTCPSDPKHTKKYAPVTFPRGLFLSIFCPFLCIITFLYPSVS